MTVLIEEGDSLVCLVVLLSTWGLSRSLSSVTVTSPPHVSGTWLSLPSTLGTYTNNLLSYLRTRTRRGPLFHSFYQNLIVEEWCLEVLGSTSSTVPGVPVNSTVFVDGSFNCLYLEVGSTSCLANRILIDFSSYRYPRVRGSEWYREIYLNRKQPTT